VIGTLLVANRGEIARRIFRTCREMGIRTVAVYSDPDIDAPFVREADEAAALGGAAPANSYLRADAIIDAAVATGADAIHPGYGFLAEHPGFARAVTDAGLVWVGPPPDAIETMGSKIASKEAVAAAGVPVLDAIDLTGLDDAAAASAASDMGFPLLVKASAGGGGKGMRLVADPDDLAEAVAGARREAASAFGDDTVFLEPWLFDPRHVEIQVFGDSHGTIVSLHERECSIQRRHQKIIEESPSPAVDGPLREQMGAAAVAAARAVGYVGAGTVEFLVHGGSFSFLEMNTRLQVEHPVTELVTGLDLVRLQLLVADGLPLPAEATAPRLRGHAIEARLYAEDVTNGFLPVTGHLHRFRAPDDPGIRVDSGVESGTEVGVHYDPMLAKIVAWADDRSEAAARLAGALERSDTGFLDRHDPSELGAPPVTRHDVGRAAVAAALAAATERRQDPPVLATIPSGWRNVPSAPQHAEFTGPYGEVSVNYEFTRRDGLMVSVDGDPPVTATLVDPAPDGLGLVLEGRLRRYRIHRVGNVHHVDGPEGSVSLVEDPRFPAAEHEEEPGSLHAPMPGKVVSVRVDAGRHVEEGEVLVVMEAMKMEHVLRAPFAGSVRQVRAREGDQVESGAVLVVVEHGGEDE
jgi:propionyl-CoA carboxylase alpha chain